MKSEPRILQLTLAATGLLLVSIALVASGSPSGYEISIYDKIPLGFWLTVGLAFVLYSVGLIKGCIGQRRGLSACNLIGLTSLNFLLLAAPVFRYQTYYTQWDVWFHLGWTTDIVHTGRVNLASDYYPSLHVLWASLAQLTGYSVPAAGLYLGPFIAAIDVPLLYVLSARIFKSPEVGAAASILGAIPNGIFGMSPAPIFYSFTLVIGLFFVLVLRQETPRIGVTGIAMVVATSVATAHPLAMPFALLAISLTLWVLPFLNRMRNWSGSASESPSVGAHRGAGTLLLYAFVVYVSWIALLTFALQISLNRLALAAQVGGIINPVQYGRFLTIPLLLKLYGPTGILGIYWLLGVWLLWKRGGLGHGFGPRLGIFAVVGTFVLAAAFENVAAGLGIGETAALWLTSAFLFLPIIAGWYLWRHGHTGTSAGRKQTVLILAAIIPFVLSIAATYPSPYVALFNYQNTSQVYSSIDWSATYLPTGPPILSNSYLGRHAFFPLRAIGNEYLKLYHFGNTIPSNFTQYLESASNVSYLILDKETIEVAGMGLRAWSVPSPGDVLLLNSWQGTERFYDDGEVQIYATYPN